VLSAAIFIFCACTGFIPLQSASGMAIPILIIRPLSGRDKIIFGRGIPAGAVVRRIDDYGGGVGFGETEPVLGVFWLRGA
jgi:hypothetical protein